MSKLLEQINTESKQYQISDLADIKYGFGLPEPKRIKGSIPVYASSGIVGYHNEARVNNSAIIIGRKGNVGSLYFSEQPSFPIDTAFFIDEPKGGFDLKYIFYLLKRINLPRYGGDSAVPGLSRDTVYSLQVETPKLPTQKKIAEILSAYDAKIENNNKIIKNLEATAQTIFNEWFINFRFPEHKKVKMIESEMGEIPMGWIVGNIEDVVERLSTQKTYKEDSLLNRGSIPVYDQSSKGIIGFCEEEPSFEANIDNPVLIFGDHTCRTQIICEPFSLGPNTIPLGEKDGYSPIFTYFLTKDSIDQREYKRHWSELSSIEFVIPPVELAKTFVSKIKSFISEMVVLEKENVKLKESRNQLLAKLI